MQLLLFWFTSVQSCLPENTFTSIIIIASCWLQLKKINCGDCPAVKLIWQLYVQLLVTYYFGVWNGLINVVYVGGS